MDEANDVFDDVEDALCAPVDENNVPFDNHRFQFPANAVGVDQDQPEVAPASFVSLAAVGRSYQAVFANPAAGTRPV